MTAVQWTKGYTQVELDRMQRRFSLSFPPDLVALLRRKRPVEGYDWTDEAAVKRALDWPLNGLLTSVENGSLWWPEWGPEPSSVRVRKLVLQEVISQAPKLIPLIGHRYLPEQPHEAGNPIFSIFYTDAVYYGVNLKDYFERESKGWDSKPWPTQIKYVPFWSDLVERFAHNRNRGG